MTDVFYGPRSRSNARALLASAEALGLAASVVRTTMNGYLVPAALVESMESLSGIEEGKVYEVPSDEIGLEGEAPARPNVNDSKADWSRYATAIGLSPAEDVTKADLIDMVKTAEKEND